MFVKINTIPSPSKVKICIKGSYPVREPDWDTSGLLIEAEYVKERGESILLWKDPPKFKAHLVSSGDMDDYSCVSGYNYYWCAERDVMVEVIETTQASPSGPLVNNHTCIQCGNKRLNISERICWSCGTKQ